MLLGGVRKNLSGKFINWGWLAPAFFPFLEAIGRGPLNTCLAIYLAWGLFALSERGLGGQRKTVVLFFVVLGVFGLGLFGAESFYKGVRTWLKYSFVLLTYFMTLHALSENRSNWHRQFKCLALASILTVIALLIRGVIMSDWQHLVPVRGLFERNLPFLLPFLLFAVKSISNQVTRWVSYSVACGIFSLIVIYSGGRSALIGLVVSLAIYGIIGFRLRLRTVLIVCLLIVMSAAILGGPKGVLMTRGLSLESSIDFDSLSTGRTMLWRHALEYPPENQLLGVGMNNVRFFEDVVHIRNVAGMPDQKVKHLHNFLFDLWYETGFLGMFVYLVFIASFVLPPLRSWKTYSDAKRLRIAPIIAAICAIFAAGCLSFSYYSPQMSGYLFFLLAALTSLSSDSVSRPEGL